MARILIVDDDEDFLRLLSEYMQSVGFEHEVAAGAQQARSCLEKFHYDVVISDFNMPGESGHDLFRYVTSAYPQTKFALMTGHDLKIKRESLSLGVHAFLQKPFYLSELRQTIRNLLQSLQPDEQGETSGPDRIAPHPSSALKIAFCGEDGGEFLQMRRVLEEVGRGDAIWKVDGELSPDTLCVNEENIPDVVLLEILMLFKVGFENFEKIKSDVRIRKVPMLLLAGVPEYAEAVLKSYPNLKVAGILTKPVTGESLENLLKPYRAAAGAAAR
ncbi:MAG: response regulator [Syntrophobacteraceae bacterium]